MKAQSAERVGVDMRSAKGLCGSGAHTLKHLGKWEGLTGVLFLARVSVTEPDRDRGEGLNPGTRIGQKAGGKVGQEGRVPPSGWE